MLEAFEEAALLSRWQTKGDDIALNRLVQAYRPLVLSVARAYRTPGVSLDDLIQEGQLGLVQAIHRFDSTVGTRLGTYARWWITAYISNFARRNRSVISSGLPSPPRGGTAEDRREARRKIASVNSPIDVAFDVPMGGGNGQSAAATLADNGPGPDEIVADRRDRQRRQAALQEGLEVLDERERRILAARFLMDQPPTRAELGRTFALTGERIRQIELNALRKLKGHLAHTA